MGIDVCLRMDLWADLLKSLAKECVWQRSRVLALHTYAQGGDIRSHKSGSSNPAYGAEPESRWSPARMRLAGWRRALHPVSTRVCLSTICKAM